MEERYLREKQFHDLAYDDHRRDDVVEKYYKIVGSRVRFYEELLISRCPGRRVLEYGCGQGGHAYLLAEKGASVTAIDLSETAIEQAKELAKTKGLESNADFRIMNAEALDFEDDTFDVVCGTAIIHHLDLNKAFSEIARVLKPDGLVVFMEPMGHNPLINLYRRLTPRLRTEDEHPLLIEDFELARSFFGEVEARYFHLLSLLAVPFGGTRAFPSVLRALDAADRFLFRYLPSARKHAWYAVMILGRPRYEHRYPVEHQTLDGSLPSPPPQGREGV
jgi:SAM-dependent methyltransferase